MRIRIGLSAAVVVVLLRGAATRGNACAAPASCVSKVVLNISLSIHRPGINDDTSADNQYPAQHKGPDAASGDQQSDAFGDGASAAEARDNAQPGIGDHLIQNSMRINWTGYSAWSSDPECKDCPVTERVHVQTTDRPPGRVVKKNLPMAWPSQALKWQP